MSKKEFLANILFNRLGPAILPVSRCFRSKRLPVLAYHRINSLPDPDYPFSSGTITATPEEFDKQMAFVSNHFTAINFGILSDLLSSAKPLPSNPIIITFDDGYEDNYTEAWPILKHHNLTATIFISTSYIDSGELFWYDKMHYMFRKTSQPKLTLESGKHVINIPDNNRLEAIESVNRIFFTASNKDRLRLFQEIEDQSQVNIADVHLQLALK
jgi:hypothetical protein